MESVIIVWKCKKRHQKVSYCKDSFIIKEEELHKILHDGILQSLFGLNKLDVAVTENIQSVLSQNEELPKLTKQISETRQQVDLLINAVAGLNPEEKSRVFQQIKILMDSTKALEVERENLQHQHSEALADKAALGRISQLSDTLTELPEKYDDSLTRELVKSVVVHGDGAVTVQFIDGSEMKWAK